MFIVGTSFLPSHYPLVKKERKKKTFTKSSSNCVYALQNLKNNSLMIIIIFVVCYICNLNFTFIFTVFTG